MNGMSMKIDLSAIAFDHFQRYANSARLIESLGDGVVSALEVGANRQRLLAQFLPRVRFIFSDLLPLPDVEDGFVQADATALPFADTEFDATICLDVVEHMPPEVRPKAIAEMARVSRRMVVVAFPVDQPWVHDAEARANGYWEHYFGTKYPWLDEHQEFGLVDGDQIEKALRDEGMQVLRFGHADVDVWAGMMGAHFTKEKLPELQGLVAAADRLYNSSVFPGDRGKACYREFFVGVRSEVDLERVRGASIFSGRRDEPAAALLAGLAETIRPLADRALKAEANWSETAEHARRVESSLGEAAQRTEQAEAHAARASEEWRITVERVRELEASLDTACNEWAASAERVRRLEADNLLLQRRQRLLVKTAAVIAAVVAAALCWLWIG
jgi:hypothetical protein